MSKPCSICTHKNRDQIDQCLVRKVPYRNIVERFGVSLGALNRHVNEGHIQQIIKEAQIIAEAKVGLDIQVCAQEIYDLCFTAAKIAKKKDLKAVGSCISPAVKVLELLNKGDEPKPQEAAKESGFSAAYLKRAKEVYAQPKAKDQSPPI